PVEPVARGVRLVSAGQPEGPAESPGTRGGPRHVEPAPVHLVRLVRVDQDVAVAVVHPGPLDPHLLLPAVLAAERVRVGGEGQGRRGKGRFWGPPASPQKPRAESGSSLGNGRTPGIVRIRHCPAPAGRRSTSAVDQRSPPVSSARRQRPRWWEQATIPGRIDSVTQTLSTNEPISVKTFTRSLVRTPSRSASRGCSHRGFECEIS